MSSLTRRMEIRGMKQCGYRRLPFILRKNDDGSYRKQVVKRGGLIADPEGKLVGRHWPRAHA